jgi:hypothetical protein
MSRSALLLLSSLKKKVKRFPNVHLRQTRLLKLLRQMLQRLHPPQLDFPPPRLHGLL